MSKQKSKKDNKSAQREAAMSQDNSRARTQVQGGGFAAKRAEVPGGAKRVPAGPARELTFGKQTYIFMGIGFALVMIGLLLMSGGRGTEYSEFDVDQIYGFRRITLAPIVILSGLGVVIYGIFKK
jgi:predicted cobalt transporter CbtA